MHLGIVQYGRRKEEQMNNFAIGPSNVARTYAFICFVFAALLLLSGCAGPALRGDATELAKVGRATLQTTAGFYTSVETTASAMLEEELMGQALYLTLHDCAMAPPSDACKTGISKIREQSNILPSQLAKWQAALHARSVLVMRLSSVYDGFSGLAENDLGAALASKSDGLIQSVESITTNPVSGAAASLVKAALGELGTAVQNSQLSRGEAGIESAVAAYRHFFDAEFGAWQTMSMQLTESSSQNITYLLQQNFASLGNAPEQRIAAYGLEPKNGN